MKKVAFILLTGLLIGLFPLQSKGSHIAALDLSLRNVGGNDYLVTFVLYRDCSGISAPTSISLNFDCSSFGSMNFVINQIPMLPNSGQEVTPSCGIMPTRCSGGTLYGIQEYTYQTQVTLPPCNFWRVRWSTCCRNPSNTIQSPTSQSAYIEATLDNLTAPGISSPQVTNLPSLILNTGKLNIQTPGAIDIDGDSLFYSLVTPFNNSHNTFVNYLPPHSATQPLPSSPPVTLDPVTGILAITPTMNIVAPISIKIEKWRSIGGIPVLLGTVYRDMQVNTITTTFDPPVLSGMDTTLTAGYHPLNTTFFKHHCIGNPINFAIWGHDPDTFNVGNLGDPEKFNLLWNWGIPSAGFIPYHQNTDSAYAIFSWNPTINHVRPIPHCFTVAIKDNTCPYNQFNQYVYCILVQGTDVDLGSDTVICGGTSLPITATTSSSNPMYTWKLNGIPVGPPQVSNQYQFITAGLAPGNYTVSAEVVSILTPSSCPGFGQKVIQVLPQPTPNLGPDTAVGFTSIVNLDAGNGYTAYLWSTGDTVQLISVDSTGTGAGTASIWVQVTGSNGCEGSDTLLVHFVHNPGIETSLTLPSIRIFPNPSNGHFSLEIQQFSGTATDIEIFGIDGKLVWQKTLAASPEEHRVQMDAGHLEDGIYLIKVSNTSGTVVRKILISK